MSVNTRVSSSASRNHVLKLTQCMYAADASRFDANTKAALSVSFFVFCVRRRYVFGNPRSNYESSTTNVTCSAEPDFRPFSDDIIAAWVEIVSSGSHPSAWPPAVASSDLTAPPKLYYLNELAAGGPAFSARTEDSTFVTRCQMWDSVDAAAAVRKGLVPEQPSNAPAPAPAPVTPTPSPGNIVLTEWVIVGLVIAIAMVLGLVVVGIMFAVKRKRSTTRTATTYLASSTSSEQAASSRDTGNTEKLLK